MEGKKKPDKSRDKHLCQICLEGKYDTFYRYNYNQLEVHHIIPIEEDNDKKLDSEKLITLCNMHHKMAEDNKISREELQEIVARKYRTPGIIKAILFIFYPPQPTFIHTIINFP